MSAEPRHEVRDGDLICLDCGSIVVEQAAHTRFHSILSGHAWAIAVLKTTHVGAGVHDRYDAYERINSKHFDSWTNDALAEVTSADNKYSVKLESDSE